MNAPYQEGWDCGFTMGREAVEGGHYVWPLTPENSEPWDTLLINAVGRKETARTLGILVGDLDENNQRAKAAWTNYIQGCGDGWKAAGQEVTK